MLRIVKAWHPDVFRSQVQSMPTVDDIARFLDEHAPPSLAEEWDNVGLLVGDRRREVRKVMTCLTVTEASAAEAVEEQADLIVTHHPLPFRPFKRLTTDNAEGRLLWQLIGSGVSIYSAHTAFDSAGQGINQLLAEGLGLEKISPLRPIDGQTLGSGRYGALPQPLSLEQVARRVESFLGISAIQGVGQADRQVSKIGVACGSGGEFLSAAVTAGCDCLVTGEARFHACLEAEASGVALLLTGHFASERFGVERLAEALARQFSSLQVWASRRERDPVRWL